MSTVWEWISDWYKVRIIPKFSILVSSHSSAPYTRRCGKCKQERYLPLTPSEQKKQAAINGPYKLKATKLINIISICCWCLEQLKLMTNMPPSDTLQRMKRALWQRLRRYKHVQLEYYECSRGKYIYYWFRSKKRRPRCVFRRWNIGEVVIWLHRQQNWAEGIECLG